MRRDRKLGQAEAIYGECIARLEMHGEEGGYEDLDPKENQMLLGRCLESLADLWVSQAEAEQDWHKLEDAFKYYKRAQDAFQSADGPKKKSVRARQCELKAADMAGRLGDTKNAESTYAKVHLHSPASKRNEHQPFFL